jgi:uncharacterized membrane protein
MSYTTEEDKKNGFESLTSKIRLYVMVILSLIIAEVTVMSLLKSQALDENYSDVITISANLELMNSIIKKDIDKATQIIINKECYFSEIKSETPKKIKKDVQSCSKHIRTMIETKNLGISSNDIKSLNNILKRLQYAEESSGKLIIHISNSKLPENLTLSYIYDSEKSLSEQNMEGMNRENIQITGVTLSVFNSFFLLPISLLIVLVLLYSNIKNLALFIKEENYIQKHNILFQKRIFFEKVSIGKLLIMLIVGIACFFIITLFLMYKLMIDDSNNGIDIYMVIVGLIIVVVSALIIHQTAKLQENITPPNAEV